MSNWIKHQVAQLIADNRLIIGDGYRAKNSELGETGLPFARVSNVNNGFHFENADRFPKEDLDRVGEKTSCTGDVVFTSKGTVGRFAFVGESVEQFVYSPQLCYWRSLDSTVIDSRFLFYWMQGREFWLQVHGMKGQTDMADYVSLRDQRRMVITLPKIEEQKEIAAVLSAFDDKIELNRQMNATLEEMAHALFKSWFVDFDPVRRNQAGQPSQPYDHLFPDKLVVDENSREIPEGWHIGKLGDIAKNYRETIRPDELTPETPYIGLGHMPQKSIALTEWGEADEVNSNKYQFQAGSFLFGKLRPYFHKVGIAPVDGVCSTDILVILPKREIWSGLVLGHISSELFVDYTTAVSTGTRMPRTNWKNMSQYAVAIPSQNIAHIYNELLQPMFEQITNTIFESKTLGNLRDTLLPRFMSGNLRVQ